jgi:hypothetical protein
VFAHPRASVTALPVATGIVLALVGVVRGTVALVAIGVVIECWALIGAATTSTATLEPSTAAMWSSTWPSAQRAHRSTPPSSACTAASAISAPTATPTR